MHAAGIRPLKKEPRHAIAIPTSKNSIQLSLSNEKKKKKDRELILERRSCRDYYSRVIGVGHDILAVGRGELERVSELIGFVAAGDLL